MRIKTLSELKKLEGFPIAKVDLRVAFHDVDSMKVVWHGNYFKYFEHARCAVLKAIDYDYPQMHESGYEWPVIDINARYVSPASYDELITVVAIITEWEFRLLIRYMVFGKESQKIIARGRSVQVPLDRDSLSMELGCPIVLEQKVNIWKSENQDR